jgi:hypothetical protein
MSYRKTMLGCALLALVSVPAIADSIHDNYRYTSSTAISVTAGDRTSTLTDSASGTLTATNRGADVKFVFSSDGHVCKLTGKLSGESIRFHANQSCTFGDETMRLTASLSAGSGTVDEDGALELELVWNIKGTVQGEPVRGTAHERTSATPR